MADGVITSFLLTLLCPFAPFACCSFSRGEQLQRSATLWGLIPQRPNSRFGGEFGSSAFFVCRCHWPELSSDQFWLKDLKVTEQIFSPAARLGSIYAFVCTHFCEATLPPGSSHVAVRVPGKMDGRFQTRAIPFRRELGSNWKRKIPDSRSWSLVCLSLSGRPPEVICIGGGISLPTVTLYMCGRSPGIVTCCGGPGCLERFDGRVWARPNLFEQSFFSPRISLSFPAFPFSAPFTSPTKSPEVPWRPVNCARG